MEKMILLVQMGNRKETSIEVQKIFTDFGCIIKTRLGLHGCCEKTCSDTGLIILELCGEKNSMQDLSAKLGKVEKVKTKLIPLPL